MSPTRPIRALLVLLPLFLPRPAQALAGWEETAGDVLTAVVPLGALYVTHRKDDTEGRTQWLWSSGTSLLVNSALRLAFNETDLGERPNGKGYGFPSGHTGFIAAGAAFLQERYGYEYGIPAWLMTGFVAYTRVASNHHHWRDTIAGATVAVAVSHWLVTPFPPDDAKPSVFPLLLEDGGGVQLEYHFR